MSAIWTQGALWLLQTSAIACVLILLALLLARFTSQPARRQRLCELALAAAILATALRLAPAWLVIGLPLLAQEPAARALVPTALQGSHGLQLMERPWQHRGVPGTAVLPPPGQAEWAPEPLADEPAREEAGSFAAVFVLGVYGAGMLFFLVRWLRGLVYLRRLVHDTEPVPPEVLEQLGVRACAGRGTRLLLSRRLRVPISCGVWKPTVVLPASFCEPGARAKLPWIFAHELTHIERRDAASALLFALGQALFFHLPWFWQLRKQVRLCQEYVADAAAALERPADEYAEFLLSLTETKAVPLGATGVGGPVSDLFRRVTMLLENPLRIEKRCPRLWTWGVAGLLVPLAALLGGLRAQAADTIIIIIPGQKASQPAKDNKPQAGVVKDKDAIGLWLERAGDKDQPIVLRLDDKGAVVKERVSGILRDWVGGNAVKPVRSGALFLVEKNDKSAPATKDELDKLKKAVQELEELLLPISPDTKDLGELTKRLRERIKALETKPPSAPKTDNAPKRKGAKDAAKADASTQLLYDLDMTSQLQNYIDVARAQVDLKKLEKLLEQVQEAPGKVDPQEIRKALEEIRRAVPSIVAYGNELVFPETKGRFGIRLNPPGDDLREYLGLPTDQGIVIEAVYGDSPAAKAGLKAKDIVLKLNGAAIPSDLDKALKIFESVKDGASSELTILRQGKEKVIKGLVPQQRWVSEIRSHIGSAEGRPLLWSTVRPWIQKRTVVAESDQVPEKGALVSILNDGAKFTAKHREKKLSITIQGAIKDGRPADFDINVAVDGISAFKGSDLAAVPEQWRQRVNRLLELSRAQDPGSERP